MKGRTLLSLFFIALLFVGFRGNDDIQKGKNELIKADTEFSNLSVAKGMHEAFLTYLDEKAVLLRSNGYPIEGKAEVKKTYDNNPDTGIVLTWKPTFADIAESGELGYTYGIYELKINNPGAESVIERGTYATVWKKDKTGSWKVILDVGNEGLEPKDK